MRPPARPVSDPVGTREWQRAEADGDVSTLRRCVPSLAKAIAAGVIGLAVP
jgi:hypothetical protein